MIINPFIGTAYSEATYIAYALCFSGFAMIFLYLFAIYLKKANPNLTHKEAFVLANLYYYTDYLPNMRKGMMDVLGEIIGDIEYVLNRIIYLIKGKQWKYGKKDEEEDPLEGAAKYFITDPPARGLGRLHMHLSILLMPSTWLTKAAGALRFIPLLGKIGKYVPRIGVSVQKTITIIRSHGIRVYIKNVPNFISLFKKYPGALYEIIKFRGVIVALMERFTNALSALGRKLQEDIKTPKVLWESSRSTNSRLSMPSRYFSTDNLRISNYDVPKSPPLLQRVVSNTKILVRRVTSIISAPLRLVARTFPQISSSFSRAAAIVRQGISRLVSVPLSKILGRGSTQTPRGGLPQISRTTRSSALLSISRPAPRDSKQPLSLSVSSISRNYQGYKFSPRLSARKF